MTRILAVAALIGALEVPPAGVWREAPAYLRLFAPSGQRAASYHMYVSTLDVATLVDRLAGEQSLLRTPGSWTPAAVLPLDAFGQTGSYDRAKLARLYGSKRAIVARGPRAREGRPAEGWTLISPYPSMAMDRLEPGTLLIVLEFP